MSVITSIKPQRNGKRVNIYLDGKFGFGIDLENFIGLGLKVEQELTEDQLTQIIDKAEFTKVLNNLLNFATLRPRSTKELKDWLRRKKVSVSIHTKLFSRLKRLDLVADKKFAQWWVEQRVNFRPRSKRMLNYELRIKGVNREIISEVLKKTDSDEVEMAKRLLARRKNRDWETNATYLARKGFDWGTIKKVKSSLDD
ncbi:hypothetical protein A2630_00930 [Candidatus Woesebacteria bacterium RIFCSPHIGHO2_01_FULL_44_10]|uniref:Regulatory protein RecX n=1 Tax=Candidatus Woesebacteria bacterium RIFCSPLOWO2_01_FULL_44_14 TaxID=1802525 RepID=A0A1F8C1K4_9BACT|nr:MAG: hypothetical protein A2630_00930 [Candidatus Woesebacteria bacterium RIFCSPHIGHO2_01_FULL_44_10]OGM54315.1 MAG: hypothetical protein A3F62_00995 [Candidatus Woesebacteria bacterium RIFCSPHIGHO2_12_FULL_44_11]OGM70216.1 MAG: hypothetical protein A2975_04045 [Candidatus Woesebacteria bacterium RIFCSPLOWO2_01_FULL_44_14]